MSKWLCEKEYKALNKKLTAGKMGIKDGLKHATHYLALATLYGDVGGTYEPQRMDWYRAQYATELPDPLPAKCMYVHVTDDSVELILRGGNKAYQDVDQDLSDVSPLLAGTLRKWMPHAKKSAQPDEEYPHVIFKTAWQKTYGQAFTNKSDDYGSMVNRAWTMAKVNPHEDAKTKGRGCDWARAVTGRARRGVVCKEGEKADNAAATAQGHAPATERDHYRSI